MVEGDASDIALLRRLAPGCTAVFPFAGESGAARSVRNPAEDLSANVTAQLNLLEVLRTENPTARAVYPGSRLQYGHASELPVGEQHTSIPTSIYGLHKQVAEGYFRLYSEIHGLPLTRLRITNPYGPRQDRSDRAFGVVGNFIDVARRNESITLWGGGSQLRDYLYIDELIDLIVTCAVNPSAIGQVYNAGSGVATSVAELAGLVVELVGAGSISAPDWPRLERDVETGDFVADISRATADLGWAPKVTLRQGLQRVIEHDATRPDWR